MSPCGGVMSASLRPAWRHAQPQRSAQHQESHTSRVVVAATRSSRPASCLLSARQLCPMRTRTSHLMCRARSSRSEDEDLVEDEEDSVSPDWDAEMSIFKKRSMKPSQLAALRQQESEASLGKVVYTKDDLVIVEGLNNDADVGTVVSFASGARGVLLWRRSDNLCFISAPSSGESKITNGTPVQCNIKGVVQVVDEMEGPLTKRQYEISKVSVQNLEGQIVNYLGKVKDSVNQESLAGEVPLIAKCPDMEDRGQICESLFTGISAVDTLAPLGRGQCILLAGLEGSGKMDLMLTAIAGQRDSGVRCVLTLIGEEEGFAETIKEKLTKRGAMHYTTIVEAPMGSSLSHCYLAVCTAMSIAEATRDAGGHAFVQHSNLGPVVQLWDVLTDGVMRVSPELAPRVPTADESALPADVEEQDQDEEMVEYEGMLISASAAQRRQFFAAIIQRAAKMHVRLGSGSLTMLGALEGTPATGIQKKKQAIIESYTTLTEEQKARMLAALEAQGKLSAVDPDADRRSIPTEVVEEFMSLTDGQVVLEGTRDSATGCMVINPAASVSRIGIRAYEKALVDIATPIRASIAQAVDAERASVDDSSLKEIERAARARAVLLQDLDEAVPLEKLVVKLLALQGGFLDSIDDRRVRLAASMCVHDCWLTYPKVMKRIRTTRTLSAEDRDTLLEWLASRDYLL